MAWRTEWQLFVAGVLLWAIMIVEVVVATLAEPDVGRAMVVGITAEMFTGRESGIPVALAGGVPRLAVFQLSVLQDVGAALLVYPLFLYALHRWHDADTYIMRRLRGIEEVADRHTKYVKRWGPAFIGAFMLVPFLINGPLVGLILGRLAGIHTRYVLPAVVAATIATAAAWTFAFDAMIEFGQRFHPLAGWYIAGGVAFVVLTLTIVDLLRERRSSNPDGDVSGDVDE